ncbi:hypothetical protein [Sinomonas atrocyanea]|uniref:hypothetical protein n=1 Tax=Sinomonas atrocyanea TaxID=37927 RepID=UPI0028554111|nr:hypothetical protein [Sinomonas atrocyanea]MDR6620834.1 hypothetical protein [Sinomonas atrocyanea]
MRQRDRDIDSRAGHVPGGGQKVIVHDGSREVHGYAVGETDGSIEVVWAVASGRHRRRAFPAEDVFIPAHAQQWAGVPISDDGLRLAARAARTHAVQTHAAHTHAAQAQSGQAHAMTQEKRAPGHSPWAASSDHAA